MTAPPAWALAWLRRGWVYDARTGKLRHPSRGSVAVGKGKEKK